ncbi:hypothetical protein GW17_00048383 [Ensete ventricosum]|nr:hypothetical protein GW17_00048383 [Ensete ventricosum]
MSSGCVAGLCLGQTPTMVRYEKLTATTESAASSPRFTWWNETHSGRRKYLRTHTSFEKETAPGKTKKWLKEKKEKRKKKKKMMMKKKKRVTATRPHSSTWKRDVVERLAAVSGRSLPAPGKPRRSPRDGNPRSLCSPLVGIGLQSFYVQVLDAYSRDLALFGNLHFVSDIFSVLRSTQAAVSSDAKAEEVTKQEMSSKDKDLVFVAGATGRVGSRLVR